MVSGLLYSCFRLTMRAIKILLRSLTTSRLPALTVTSIPCPCRRENATCNRSRYRLSLGNGWLHTSSRLLVESIEDTHGQRESRRRQRERGTSSDDNTHAGNFFPTRTLNPSTAAAGFSSLLLKELLHRSRQQTEQQALGSSVTRPHTGTSLAHQDESCSSMGGDNEAPPNNSYFQTNRVSHGQNAITLPREHPQTRRRVHGRGHGHVDSLLRVHPKLVLKHLHGQRRIPYVSKIKTPSRVVQLRVSRPCDRRNELRNMHNPLLHAIFC